MLLSSETFDCIFYEQLTPIQTRILRRILKGKLNQDILGDVTVWFDREVWAGEGRQTLPIGQQRRLDGLESGNKLIDKTLLAHHLRGVCDKFGVESTRDIEYDLREVIENCAKYLPEFVESDALKRFELLKKPPIPEGPVPTFSHFYQCRYPIEQECQTILEKAGEQAIVLRLKAPGQMGRTSLMMRLLNNNWVKSSRGNNVYIDLNDADNTILNKNFFYRWFCANVSEQLEINIGDYLENKWQKFLGNNTNCTKFFETMIFSNYKQVIFLGIDNLHRLFSHPDLQDFLLWIRTRNETAKNNDIWRKLVFIVSYSTDEYPLYQRKGSPLINVGIYKDLREFNTEEIKNLSKKHKLMFSDTQVENLKAMIGGHPYLVRLTMYHLSHQEKTLEEILHEASINNGIYNDYLKRLFEIVHKFNLTEDIRKVISSSSPVTLEPTAVFQLYSIGLVNKRDNKVQSRCYLYQKYFREIL